MAEARVVKPASGPWQFASFKVTKLDSQAAQTDLFSEVARPAGIAARQAAYGEPPNTGFTWHGAAAADWNGDGWVDLVVTGPERNWLYLNDGQGRFRDASEETGLLSAASGVGVLGLDYDNDGDTDLFISTVGEQILLENRLLADGKLSFRDVSQEMGVAVAAIGFSAAAADVNGDGRPDIYVASYNRYGQVTPDVWYKATNGTPNLFFVSQPDGTLPRGGAQVGRRRPALELRRAVFLDLDEDGKPDLSSPTISARRLCTCAAASASSTRRRSAGSSTPATAWASPFGDYNNDGRLDLHVTNMSSTAGNRILGRLFPGATPDRTS